MARGRSQPTMITNEGRWPSSRYRDPSPSHDHAGSPRSGPDPPVPAARRATPGMSVTSDRSSSSADGARPSVRSTPRTGRPGAGPESVSPLPESPLPRPEVTGGLDRPASVGFLWFPGVHALLSMTPGGVSCPPARRINASWIARRLASPSPRPSFRSDRPSLRPRRIRAERMLWRRGPSGPGGMRAGRPVPTSPGPGPPSCPPEPPALPAERTARRVRGGMPRSRTRPGSPLARDRSGARRTARPGHAPRPRRLSKAENASGCTRSSRSSPSPRASRRDARSELPVGAPAGAGRSAVRRRHGPRGGTLPAARSSSRMAAAATPPAWSGPGRTGGTPGTGGRPPASRRRASPRPAPHPVPDQLHHEIGSSSSALCRRSASSSPAAAVSWAVSCGTVSCGARIRPTPRPFPGLPPDASWPTWAVPWPTSG